MALLDVIKESISEEVIVLYSNDGDDELVEGVLVGLDASKRPDDYPLFVVVDTGNGTESIPFGWIKQFFRKDNLIDPNAEFFYVVLRYGKTERSKEHYYMSYDYTIKPGDQVLVWQDWLYVGNVIRTGFFKCSDAPYSVEKTWLIEKKVYPRVDYMQYQEAAEVIKEDNLYKDKALNSDNDHRQFLAGAEEQYQWLVDFNTRHIESRKPDTEDPVKIGQYIIGETEYNLDEEWCESNQINVFFRTLWICAMLAKCGHYNKFHFDKYLCLSLIYKHGDFDAFLLDAEYDKPNIERDIAIVDAYINNLRGD